MISIKKPGLFLIASIVAVAGSFYWYQLQENTAEKATAVLSEEMTPVPSMKQTTEQNAGTSVPLPEDSTVEVLSEVNNLKFEGSIHKIDDKIFDRIYGKSFKTDCTVSKESLRYIQVSYYGFDHSSHAGELLVNKAIADKVVKIFEELYNNKYPIEKMKLVDDYDADDETSMADNNTSCFNYRTIDGSDTLSNHSLGLAIDINPLYNPYVRSGRTERSVLPIEGEKYADRSMDCPYMIHKNDVCYKIFAKYGFTWGGDWNSTKDYQHFEIKLEY